MIESFENAKEELKRIDHLIYVTLKYTRTVDVLLSIIERMVNSYEFVIESLLKKAVSEGKIDMPDNPIAKANTIKNLHPSKVFQDRINKYLLFRKLRRVEYEKINEFRRHVTMITEVDGEKIEVHIDSITEDFHKLKSFLETVEKIIKND